VFRLFRRRDQIADISVGVGYESIANGALECVGNLLATRLLAKAKVEILAKGQQFVGFGIHPDTKAPYSWPEQSQFRGTSDEPGRQLLVKVQKRFKTHQRPFLSHLEVL
jgi:hypothetical protein